MPLKRQQLLSSITDNLGYLSKSTGLENSIGLFDTNRLAQDFFKDFLSLVLNYPELKELDKLNGVLNHPAIDLGDANAKVCFQITVDASTTKIQDTIKLFLKHDLHETYDRLIILIIGKKEAYPRVVFSTDNKFVFSKENDIWDDDSLIKAINAIEDIEKLESIKKFLEANLLEMKFPDRLFPDDIRTSIEKLSDGMGPLLSNIQTVPLETSNRDGDFIKDKKNPLNNIDWETFKEKMQGHLKYNLVIDNFLKDPVNQTLLKKYFVVCRGIQKFHEDNEKTFESFNDVFKELYNRVPNDYDDGFNNQKVKIVLHNMYFNCDIGKNPDVTAE